MTNYKEATWAKNRSKKRKTSLTTSTSTLPASPMSQNSLPNSLSATVFPTKESANKNPLSPKTKTTSIKPISAPVPTKPPSLKAKLTLSAKMKDGNNPPCLHTMLSNPKIVTAQYTRLSEKCRTISKNRPRLSKILEILKTKQPTMPDLITYTYL